MAVDILLQAQGGVLQHAGHHVNNVTVAVGVSSQSNFSVAFPPDGLLGMIGPTKLEMIN